MEINIFTDGACNNKKEGAYAFYIQEWKILVSPKKLVTTTNNRMELSAIIDVISFIKDLPNEITPEKVTIHTDSEYVIGHCVKGYKWSNNLDLRDKMKELLDELRLTKSTRFHFEYVKGHNKIYGNELVDYFANKRSNEH